MNHLVSFASLFTRLDSTVRQWTLSALQLHPWALIVVDEDSTTGTSIVLPRRTAMTTFLTSHLELHVKTVKYFKSIEYIQEQVERLTYLRRKLLASAAPLSGSSHRPHQLSAPSLEASATSPNSADLPATPSAACEHERTTHHTHRVDTHCMPTTSKRAACSLTAHHHRLLYPNTPRHSDSHPNTLSALETRLVWARSQPPLPIVSQHPATPNAQSSPAIAFTGALTLIPPRCHHAHSHVCMHVRLPSSTSAPSSLALPP